MRHKLNEIGRRNASPTNKQYSLTVGEGSPLPKRNGTGKTKLVKGEETAQPSLPLEGKVSGAFSKPIFDASLLKMPLEVASNLVCSP